MVNIIKQKTTFILFLLFLSLNGLWGQTPITSKKNIVHLKSGEILCADDRIVRATHDTVVELPAYIDFYVRKTNHFDSDRMYQKLRDKAFRHRWSKELHNIILSNPSAKNPVIDTMAIQKSEVVFLPYEGLKIRKIYINKLDVFGPSLSEPERKPNTILGKAGNSIHFKTRNFVILNHMLFKEGDTINPYIFADNERIFRELPFIEDARIYIKSINTTEDSADVQIIVKDRWSIGFDVTTADLENFNFNIWDDNILGTGHEFQSGFIHRHNSLPNNNINGAYTVKNLGGSFINSQFGFNTLGNQDYSIHLWRDFFTQRTSYAGAVYYQNIDINSQNVSGLNNNFYYDTIAGHVFNVWLGRAFNLGNFSITSTSISNVAISAGIFSNDYYRRPPVGNDYHYEFQNKTFYLLSLAFSAQGYYKTNLVFNYGRTEDIPYGLLLKFTSGLEVNEFSKRIYNAASFSKGNYIGNAGYFYGSASISGFLDKDRFEQGMIKLSSNMFSNLLVIGQYKFRNFVGMSFTKGYNRNEDEYLNLNNMSGIRGFFSDSVKGFQKFNLNLETVCFTPHYLAGFRFAVFAFADFAYVGPAFKSVFKNALYNGFGMGFRFRNERFVFKTFQIRLAYYPWLPEHAQGDLFTISSESRFRPAGFSITSPEINQFK